MRNARDSVGLTQQQSEKQSKSLQPIHSTQGRRLSGITEFRVRHRIRQKITLLTFLFKAATPQMSTALTENAIRQIETNICQCEEEYHRSECSHSAGLERWIDLLANCADHQDGGNGHSAVDDAARLRRQLWVVPPERDCSPGRKQPTEEIRPGER